MATATAVDGTEIELHTQEDMVPAMVLSKRQCQQECLGTPSMSEPFLSDFGYLANTPAAQEVLDGTYVPPAGMDLYLIEFLAVLKMSPSIQSWGPVSITVSPTDNSDAWRKQRENTAAEPSCLSFAHHKTASLDRSLNYIDTVLCSIPLIVGFSPPAWQVITDVEILKKPGEFRVSKMRLIQLMSPEFQINNKLFGRCLLAHAEAANDISPDQHGSRKHHKSINTCLNKKLLCDSLWQKRRAGAVAMNAAKGNYDRFPTPLLLLQ